MVRGEEEAVVMADGKMGGADGGRGQQRARQRSANGRRGQSRQSPHGGGPITRPHQGPGQSARGGHGGRRG